MHFLQGDLEEEVYMLMPQGFYHTHAGVQPLCKFRKYYMDLGKIQGNGI